MALDHHLVAVILQQILLSCILKDEFLLNTEAKTNFVSLWLQVHLSHIPSGHWPLVGQTNIDGPVAY